MTPLDNAVAPFEAEAELRALVDAVANVVLVLDRDGRYLKVSTTAEDRLYLPPAELLGRRIHEVFPAKQADVFLAAIRRALTEHRVVELEYTLPIRGRTVNFAASVAPMTEDRVVWLARDVTASRAAEAALRDAEEGLRQAAGMETIGRLAGGIAHDFNNLLTGVAGYADLALDAVEESNPVTGDLKEIRLATKRAADLSRQLLAFSRGQRGRPERLDLNETLSGLNGLLRCLAGERVNLRLIPGQELRPVYADRGQIERVIVNLVVNARDAMKTGGALEVRTGNHDKHWVTLEVSDTGAGIPPHVLPRLFEPFFSTKGGRGTGLGLWSVSNIVNQAGGQVTVNSTVGFGTTFTVRLPEHLTQPDEPMKQPEDESPLSNLGGNEIILLVEDDANLRTVIARMLERFGFTVLAAANGVEALAVLNAHEQALDLLIADVVMPDLGGPELVERLTERGTDVKVLYMSGYSDHAVMRRVAVGPRRQLLRKPFTLEVLLKAVRSLLDAK